MLALQQSEDRAWQIWSGNENSKEQWKPDEKLNLALKDAAEIRLQHSSGRYIYALLPADTVPRSGLWNVDELIAAREKIGTETPTADPLTSNTPEPTASPTADPLTTRLAEIETAFRKRYDAEIGKPHADSVALLDKQIIAALERGQNAAAATGDLDAVLQWKRAVERLGSGKGVPTPKEIAAEDPPVKRPAKLLNFYQTYRDQLAKLEAARDEKGKPLGTIRDEEMDRFQRELTKAGDIKGAVRVKSARASAGNALPSSPEAVPPPTKQANAVDLLEANENRYQIDYSRWGALKVVGTVKEGSNIIPAQQPDSKGINDYCFVTGRFEDVAGWMAVKRNGEIVSSLGDAYETPRNLKEPRWLDVGAQALAVTQNGDLVIWGETDWAPKSRLSKVVKAESADGNSIALHEDGSVSVWGPMYDNYQPEDAWLKDAVDVAAGHQQAWILGGNGRVIGWNRKGDIAKQDPEKVRSGVQYNYSEMRDIVSIQGNSMHVIGLNRRGELVIGSTVYESPGGPLTNFSAGLVTRPAISPDGHIVFDTPSSVKMRFPNIMRSAAAARNVISVTAVGKGEDPDRPGFIAWIEETP